MLAYVCNFVLNGYLKDLKQKHAIMPTPCDAKSNWFERFLGEADLVIAGSQGDML